MPRELGMLGKPATAGTTSDSPIENLVQTFTRCLSGPRRRRSHVASALATPGLQTGLACANILHRVLEDDSLFRIGSNTLQHVLECLMLPGCVVRASPCILSVVLADLRPTSIYFYCLTTETSIRRIYDSWVGDGRGMLPVDS